MSKEQVIDQIVRINRSAIRDFLDNFGEQELHSYLQRLTQVHGHRGRGSIWVRQGDTHAVVTGQAA
ncbi:MAG: hypothetical protein WD042_07440 [Phycisphaeraceae bacterium]